MCMGVVGFVMMNVMFFFVVVWFGVSGVMWDLFYFIFVGIVLFVVFFLV